MNSVLIFYCIFLVCWLVSFISIIHAMEGLSDYYPVPHYPKQPIRLMPTPGNPPPSVDEFLKAVFNDIRSSPHLPVSAIREKHRQYYLAFSPSGQANPVDTRCHQECSASKKLVTVGVILACRFVLNYVKEDLHQSQLVEMNVAGLQTIMVVYNGLLKSEAGFSREHSNLSNLLYRFLKTIIGPHNINSILSDCENVILPNPAGRQLYLVVACDFVKAYKNAIVRQ